ncbi:hypothetical protein GCM10020256_59870 [Streptomyces thermocoprophilus]
MGVGAGVGGHLGGAGEVVAGQPGVHEVGGDAAAAQQPAARLQGAEFTAPGEIAGGRAVRLQAEERWAPAAYREPGLRVEEGGARGGGPSVRASWASKVPRPSSVLSTPWQYWSTRDGVSIIRVPPLTDACLYTS